MAAGPRMNVHQHVGRRDPGYTVEDDYIVTSVHHRPWGAGDDNTTVGVFPTEKEAKAAAETDFQRVASQADGWEEEWRRVPRDGMLQLRGCIEDGEDDTEKYTASIKLVQRQRPIAVQPRAPSAAPPRVRTLKPRFVYVVREEQRMNVGEDDPQGYYNELGDLKSVKIHGIYTKLDDANDSAREVHEGVVESLVGHGDTVTDTLKDDMAAILVTDVDQMMTYSIEVERRRLE